MLALVCVEVDGVWTEETAWGSAFVCADVPSCCCEFVVSFGWDSDEGPGCGNAFPDVLECAGVCTCMAGRGAIVALASLEVEGTEAGSGFAVETPKGALLRPTT